MHIKLVWQWKSANIYIKESGLIIPLDNQLNLLMVYQNVM